MSIVAQTIFTTNGDHDYSPLGACHQSATVASHCDEVAEIMDGIRAANGQEGKIYEMHKPSFGLEEYENGGSPFLVGVDRQGHCYQLRVSPLFSSGTALLDLASYTVEGNTVSIKTAGGQAGAAIALLPSSRATMEDLLAELGFEEEEEEEEEGGGGGYTPPEGAVDVSLLEVSEKGKETLARHEGGCVNHVYNDYKGAKSDFCKEHYNPEMTIKEGHKIDAYWSGNRCESNAHYASGKILKGYGNPTISVGYLIRNEAELFKYCSNNGGYLTAAECLEIFSDILPLYVDDLKNALPGKKLNQCQFDALVSIVYNRGIGIESSPKYPDGTGFRGSKLYKGYLKHGNFSGRNEEQRLKIREALINDGSRIAGSQRRIDEADLYFDCKY